MIKTYNAAEVTFVMGGKIISGFALGTFLSITFDEPESMTTTDVHGKANRVTSNNKSATANVILTQFSPSNDDMSDFFNAARQGIEAAYPLLIKHEPSNTLITSPGSWIQSLPTIEFSNVESNREWTVRMVETSVYLGGMK